MFPRPRWQQEERSRKVLQQEARSPSNFAGWWFVVVWAMSQSTLGQNVRQAVGNRGGTGDSLDFLTTKKHYLFRVP